jgi:hypothetical protein
LGRPNSELVLSVAGGVSAALLPSLRSTATFLRSAQATRKLDERDIHELLAHTDEEDIMQTFIDRYIEQGKRASHCCR